MPDDAADYPSDMLHHERGEVPFSVGGTSTEKGLKDRVARSMRRIGAGWCERDHTDGLTLADPFDRHRD
jgi:hypothetical protein